MSDTVQALLLQHAERDSPGLKYGDQVRSRRDYPGESAARAHVARPTDRLPDFCTRRHRRDQNIDGGHDASEAWEKVHLKDPDGHRPSAWAPGLGILRSASRCEPAGVGVAIMADGRLRSVHRRWSRSRGPCRIGSVA